jgi:hypothetical protein
VRDGTTQKIGVASDVVVTDLVKTTLDDVKTGSYIGVTGMPWPMVARRRSLSIFFLNRRVAPPRFRQYDLRPNSTMTNDRRTEVDANDGKSLSVKYKAVKRKSSFHRIRRSSILWMAQRAN